MKKAFWLIRIIFSASLVFICFISCKNTTESKLVYSENNTIKQNVKEKEHDITWTAELEEERLTKTINRNSIELGSDVPYNKELFKILKTMKAPVYPSISEFGSLDTTNLRIQIKEKLNKFCEALASENHNGADAYFSSKYIFNYVFFINDLETGWKTNFDSSIPDTVPVFTKWIFGEPFNGSDIIQIPVRFYADCGIIDMTVFLSSVGNNEFNQITIDRWQKYDGTR